MTALQFVKSYDIIFLTNNLRCTIIKSKCRDSESRHPLKKSLGRQYTPHFRYTKHITQLYFQGYFTSKIHKKQLRKGGEKGMVRVDVKKLQDEIIAQMLTQDEVAKKTKLSASTICRILKGENLVRYRTAAKLAQWLRHSPRLNDMPRGD